MTLIIKETTEHDFEHIQTLWNCPEVMHYVGFPAGLGITLDQLKLWYESLQASSTSKHFSIYEEGHYCGETFYRILEDKSSEVDIKLLPDARGRSIASYALSHTLAHVLYQENCTHAIVDPNPDNHDAVNLYKHLGFELVDEAKNIYHVTQKTFKPSSHFMNAFITIKPVPHEDLKRLWEISEKEVWYAYCNTNAPYFYEYKPTTLEGFIQHHENRIITGIYAMDQLIGAVNWYWENQETRWLEIGLVIYDEAYWGKGIGTYCLNYQTDTLFETIDIIDRVGFVTWSGNRGMMRSGDKAHFKCEGILRNVRYYEGTYYDSVRYGLTRDEWMAFKQAAACIEIKDASQKQRLCDTLLRKNPHHFGIEASIRDYVEQVAHDFVFATPNQNGFISLKPTSESVLEINVMAVDPDYHHQGFGTHLINRAIMTGRENGYQYLLVKTLADTHPDSYYALTRCFYESFGFEKTQLFSTLWGDENPCQEYLLKL